MRTAPLRLRALVLACLAAGLAGAAIGLSFPTLSLAIEAMTGSSSAIGLHAGAAAISTLAVAPFVPRLLSGIELRKLIIAAAVLAAACFAVFPASQSMPVWIVARFGLGVGLTLVFIAAEIWVNAVASPRWRGRALGAFSASLALGLAGGAALAALLAAREINPYPVGIALSLAPLLAVLVRAPQPRRHVAAAHGIADLWRVGRLAPSALVAAAAFGAIETGMLNFLPVWGVRAGYSPADAASLLAAIAFGNVLLLPLIGWMADRLGPGRTLTFCAAISVIAPLSLYVLTGQLLASLVAAFILGGMVTGLYAVGLTLLASRVATRQLASANAAFVTAYGVGSLIAPPVASVSMQIVNPHGVLFAFAFLGTVVLFARLALARHDP